MPREQTPFLEAKEAALEAKVASLESLAQLERLLNRWRSLTQQMLLASQFSHGYYVIQVKPIAFNNLFSADVMADCMLLIVETEMVDIWEVSLH